MKTKLFIAFSLLLVSLIGYSYWCNCLLSPESTDQPGPDSDKPFTLLPASSVEIYDGYSFATNVTAVDLSGRGLTGSLKAEVRLLSSLRELDLSDNRFTGLPAEVGQLSKLEVLDLANNQFTGLPHELANLQNLRTLDLRGNDISEFDLEVITAALPESTSILR